MPGPDRITIYEVSEEVRHFEIAFGGAELARLYCETFRDAAGQPQSTSRLHFDGDIRPDIMREVIESVTRDVLVGFPRGVCVVYRGHLVSSFDYPGPAKLPS